MIRLACCLVVLAASTGAFSFSAAGQDWPQFRGPDGQGHASATGLPAVADSPRLIKLGSRLLKGAAR